MTKSYHLTITKHGRERYIQRVVDPERYRHLHNCRQTCFTCAKLEQECQTAIRFACVHIDSRLAPRVLDAISAGSLITDEVFLEAAGKLFTSEEQRRLRYYRDLEKQWVIYVVAPDKPPALVTVLTNEIVEEMSLRACGSQNDYQRMFRKWKRESHGRHLRTVVG